MDLLKHLCLVDFETTGLRPDQDRIVEMAAMHGLNGEGGLLTTLVQLPVNMELPPEAARVNNLTTEQIHAWGMHPDSALHALASFVGYATIVSHNAAYDTAIWDQHNLRFGMRPFTNNFLCTKTLAAALLPGLPSYSLQKLYLNPALDINQPTGQAHRALGDVQMMAALLRYLFTLPNAQDVARSLINKCGRGKAHYPPKGFLPRHAEEIDQFEDGPQQLEPRTAG